MVRLATKKTRPRNAAATRQRILDRALDAFARRGYEGVSLDDLAVAVGVRKATLFYYFGSKADLYEEVARSTAARYAPLAIRLTAERPSIEGLCSIVGELHDILARSHESAGLVMREALDARTRRANRAVGPLVAAGERYVREGQRRGVFSREISAEAALASAVGAVTLPFLNPGLFSIDRAGAIAFVRRALAVQRRRHR